MEQSGLTFHWNNENLMFRRVDRLWDSKLLLSQKGWFPLPDAMRTLDPKNTGRYRKILAIREKLIKAKQDPTQAMGIRQFGARLWAHMPIFSEWYTHNEVLRVNRIPKEWDLQTFLQQNQGIFTLRGALELLPDGCPLKYPTVKNLIQKSQDPREEMGAAKLEDAGYVVYMPDFAHWLNRFFT